MAVRDIVIAPDAIFTKVSTPVGRVDEAARALIADLFETLHHERALGLAAPMIGVSSRVCVIDLREGEDSAALALIDPEILEASAETQTFEEASLSFPHVSAPVTRPAKIRVAYTDEGGERREMTAEGFLATVIQHEIDYLDGKTYPDRLSRMKRDMLLAKMAKEKKRHVPHVHGPGCRH